MPVTYPPPAPFDVRNVACAGGSRRDLDESLGQPCHACGHWACRIGPKGPTPCETCLIVAYVRTLTGGTDPRSAFEQLQQQVDDLTRSLDELDRRISLADTFPI